MRLPADQRRQQLLDVAREVFARARLPRDGRWTTSRKLRASPSRCCTSTSRASGRCTSSCSPTPATSCSTRSRPRPTACGRVASGSRAGSSPTSGSCPTAAPASGCCSARRSGPTPSSHASSTRSCRLPPTSSPTLIEIPASDEHRRVLANALVGMAESVGRHTTLRRPDDERGRRRAPGPLDLRARVVRPARRAGRRADHSLRSRTRCDAVVGTLLEHEVGASLRRLDVLVQVHLVDFAPDRSRRMHACRPRCTA